MVFDNRASFQYIQSSWKRWFIFPMLQDFQTLRELGFDEEEIMEVIAMSGMSVFYNHLANATKINIDEGFTKMLSRK
ncbi:MAG: hypothetical protein IPG31_05450 [Nitrosomonas sp.]|nr:hypothetical protein [Nitrosomonas sp.]